MAGEKMSNKTYRPAWRSFFYPDILGMILLFIAACVVSFYAGLGGKLLTILCRRTGLGW